MKQKKKTCVPVIVDGHNLVTRCTMATVHEDLHVGETKTGGIHTSFRCLASSIARITERSTLPVGPLVMVFDHGVSTFRSKLFPAYKAHRLSRSDDPKDKKIWEVVRMQLRLSRKLMRYMGIPVIRFAGIEADDVIATAAYQFALSGGEPIILSTDRDLYQIVDDYNGIRAMGWDKQVLMDEEAVTASVGIDPKWLAIYRAMVGDKSDGLPGVKGIGEKTAKQVIFGLLQLGDFKDIDEMLALAQESDDPKIGKMIVYEKELKQQFALCQLPAPAVEYQLKNKMNFDAPSLAKLKAKPNKRKAEKMLDRLKLESIESNPQDFEYVFDAMAKVGRKFF